MYLSPIQKLEGYRIVNRTLVKPVNPQRLQVLENHAIGKLPPDSDSFLKAKAMKKAAVAHYSERTRPIPEAKPAAQPSVHVAPQSLSNISESPAAKPDSPMDSKNGAPDVQVANAIKEGPKVGQHLLENCEGIMNSANVHEHSMDKCSCGKVIRNCRCMSKDKKVNIIENGCHECKAKLNNSEV